MMPNTTRPILIFTWGNPSRGDDALGTEVYDSLINEGLSDVDLLTDFQLQIEHALDLENRKCILFVDASVSANAPYEFYQLNPVEDDSFTTHAMSPASLLAVYERINKKIPPPSFMLSIRGYDFDLGLPLSASAGDNLSNALIFIRQLVTTSLVEDWCALVGN